MIGTVKEGRADMPLQCGSSCRSAVMFGFEAGSMRIISTLTALVIAWLVAVRLVGFTSAIQSQKTILLGLLLSAVLGPAAYLLAGKVARRR